MRCNMVGVPVTTTALLTPNLALKLTPSRACHLVTFGLQPQSNVVGILIAQSMFCGSHSTESDILRQMLCIAEDLCFR